MATITNFDQVIVDDGVQLTNSVPSTTTNKLYNDGGTLKFDGSAVGGGEANEFSFKTITVSGQSDVVADTTTDTLTLAAGSNVTITTDASTDTITFAATDTNTQLSTEEVQDIAGPLVATGGTKTLITVTYDDANNNMDFVVDNDLSNYDNSTSGFITATLTDEQVQDIAGGMFTGNTETRITATYQDGDGTIDLVVDDDLNNYSNTNSKFIDSNTTGGADLVSAVVVCTTSEYNSLTPNSTTLYFIKD